jgi:hypothetical protein
MRYGTRIRRPGRRLNDDGKPLIWFQRLPAEKFQLLAVLVVFAGQRLRCPPARLAVQNSTVWLPLGRFPC